MVELDLLFGWAHLDFASREASERYSDATSRLGGIVPRRSHKPQVPVQFGEAQHCNQKTPMGVFC